MDPKAVYYHVAAQANRKAIAREGLTIGNPPNYAYPSDENHPAGLVHLWTDFLFAVRWMTSYGFPTDLWVVDADGLEIGVGRFLKRVDTGAFSASPIGPERLRLLAGR